MRGFRCAFALLLTIVLPSVGCCADPPAFDFPALQALIERQRITSIEALLAALPIDLRSHYVLMFSSRSLQEGTFRDPRAILYGSDARLILSFNGDSGERGYRMLETAAYDAGGTGFRLREIRFATSSAGVATVDISPPDPAACQQCHGIPSRPIWDASPLWPGAYGERYHSNLSREERDGISRFLERQPAHPRYRNLVAAERFAYRGTFVPQAKDEYTGDHREPPNQELSDLFARLNIQMIAQQLLDDRSFPSYQYAMLGAAEGTCGPLSEFFPAALSQTAQAGMRRFLDSTHEAEARQTASKRQRALPGDSVAAILDRVDARTPLLIDVRFLAEFGLGIPTQGWTLAMEKDSVDMTASRDVIVELAESLRLRLAQNDARLLNLHVVRNQSTDDGYCIYLRQRSRAALALLPPSRVLRDSDAGSARPPLLEQQPTLTEPQLALQHCFTCHGHGAAPPLPFDRPALLAVELRRGAYPHGDLLGEIVFRLSSAAGAARMPPDVTWPPALANALSGYFTSLAQSSTGF